MKTLTIGLHDQYHSDREREDIYRSSRDHVLKHFGVDIDDFKHNIRQDDGGNAAFLRNMVLDFEVTDDVYNAYMGLDTFENFDPCI